jgi:phosphohistidine swiveling domain-containing protein
MNPLFLIGHSDEANDQIGGKAYNLNFLKKNKIDVPNGFIINKSYHLNFIEKNVLTKDFRNEIKSYLGKLDSPYFMVRSSAIGEDGKATSFAGMLDSYQSSGDIDEVLSNIQKCWASASNDRVTVYQEKKNKKLAGVAVVVQQMIEPDYAGVLFTSSPLDENDLLIEYVAGHAEKLVQGEVTPDSLSISRGSELPEAPFNLKDLLEVSKEILELYDNVPQDIEWVSKNGKISIVQSRPITTIKNKIKWSNTNVNENYPEKLSPLLYSVARRSYYHYFKNIALKLGAFNKDTEHRYEEYFSNIIGIWGHKMYYNMSSIHNIINLTPLKGILKTSFDDFVGYQENKKENNQLSKVFGVFTISTRLFYNFLFLPNKVRFIETTVDNFAEEEKESESKHDYNKIHHGFLNIRFNLWVNASFADLFAMLTHGLLGKICKNIDKENGVGLQNGLIQAIPDLISNQPIYRVWDIACLIRKHKLDEWFKETNSFKIWDDLALKNEPVFSLINNYLTEYGFRCSGELTLFMDNYLENPSSFIDMIKLYLKTEAINPRELFSEKRVQQKELYSSTLKKINKKHLNPVISFFERKLLQIMVNLTCYAISCRERVRLKQAKLYHHFKSNLVKFSNLLIENETLSIQDDIYYLEYDEISRILAGDKIDKEYIQNLVMIRKKHLEDAQEAPDDFHTHFEDFNFSIFDQDNSTPLVDGQYKGLPACSGIVKAEVKVLKTIHEIEKLNHGDILVTAQTDPGWIYAFPMISGLIVERGGMLSHGAIVAREFGIPAIVGVKNITKELSDGQVVTVNGNTGIIEC